MEEGSAGAVAGLELDALGIPLAHYHIPHRRVQPSAAGRSSSPAVAAFLSQVDALVSFLLLPHPDDERLSTRSSSTTTSTSSSSSLSWSLASSNGLALQRPYLRTSGTVTVKQIAAFLASKFPQLLAHEYAPSSLDLIVPAAAKSHFGGTGQAALRPQASGQRP